MKTLSKQSFKSILNNYKRFISIMLIVLLGVGFFVGIKVSAPNMRKSANKYFIDNNLYDIFLSSTWGVTSEEIDYLNTIGYKTSGSYSLDSIIRAEEESVVKIHSYDKDNDLNKLVLVEGKLPETNNECVIDYQIKEEYKIGDIIYIEDDNLKEQELTIVGYVNSPMYISSERGYTSLLTGEIKLFMFVPIDNFDIDYYTEAYIDVITNNDYFTNKYEKEIENDTTELEIITKNLGKERFEKEKTKATNELEEKESEYKTEKDKALKELKDAQNKINNNKSKINKNLKTLNKEEENAKNTFKEKKNELNSNITTIESNISELKVQIEYLDSIQSDTTLLKENLNILEENYTKLKSAYDTLLTTEKDTYKSINSNRIKLNNALKKLNTAQKDLDKEKAKAEAEFEKIEKEIEDAREEINSLEEPEWYVLDLESNIGYISYYEDSNRIGSIARLFPLIFYLVAILVCLTTMTRMVEDERTDIGTLKSLGYTDFQIMLKYIIYASSATIIGSVAGIFIGSTIIPKIVFDMYGVMYEVGEFINPINIYYSIIGTAIAFICIVFSTYYAIKKSLKESPAELMRPKSIKAGKRVFLERINFIWKRISFIKKVTIRNVFRYKKRFLMTIIGIAGCTALIVAGFGLQDCISGMVPAQYDDIFTYDLVISLNSDEESIKEDTSKIIELEEIKDYLILQKESIELINKETNQMITLLVPFGDIDNFIKLRNPKTKEKYVLSDKLIITEKIAKLLDIEKGNVLEFSGSDDYTLKVGEITENYVMHYFYISKEVYNSEEYNTIYVKTGNLSDEEMTNLSKKINEFDSVASLSFNSVNREFYDGTMENFTSVSYVLIISAGLLAFVVLYNLASINISERTRELATIKVLGFYDREVYQYVKRETTILTIIGMLIGCVLGYVLTVYVIKTCEVDNTLFTTEVRLISYVYSILITIVFTTIVNIATYFSLKNIKMMESLKSVE